jgi:uncharacterized protein (TIGR02246 family)
VIVVPESTDPVERLYFRLLGAWNERDAEEFGACFTAEGTMVGFDGSPVDGRSPIVEHLGAIFGDHTPACYVAIVREVRPLTSGTTLLRAVAGMVPPGTVDVEPDLNQVQVLVAVQEEGDWRIVHYQTTPAAFHGRPDAVQALTSELRGCVPDPARARDP